MKPGKRQKRAQVQMSKEERKAIKDSNNESSKAAKKCIASLEPLVKAGAKAMKLKHVPDDLEAKLSAARTMIRDAKKLVGQVAEANATFVRVDSFQYTEALIAELKQELSDKTQAAIQLDAVCKGFASKADAEAALEVIRKAALADGSADDQ